LKKLSARVSQTQTKNFCFKMLEIRIKSEKHSQFFAERNNNLKNFFEKSAKRDDKKRAVAEGRREKVEADADATGGNRGAEVQTEGGKPGRRNPKKSSRPS
jgi:hypothetical protein